MSRHSVHFLVEEWAMARIDYYVRFNSARGEFRRYGTTKLGQAI